MDLTNIELTDTINRSVSKDMRSIISDCQEEIVDTGDDEILIAVHGDRKKHPMVTYHDVGLNYASNFQAFFNFEDMKNLLKHFCVYHINAPGQHFGATNLPENYQYPSMDELSSQINFVVSHFQLKSFIGFGVGAGANILVRYAIENPSRVDCLCLINCISTATGWIEWGYQKLNIRHLRTGIMPQSVIEYLMWHHFGKNISERNPDLYRTFQYYFENHVNPHNLALFIDCYLKRSDLDLIRELDSSKRKSGDTLQMSVLNITGAVSPHIDDTVTLNGRLNPDSCSWMKISDCGMPLEEQPAKVAEAFRLFVQGAGYGYCFKTNK